MTKTCPRCGATFDCRHDDIVHCQCAGVTFSPRQRTLLQQQYSDCLCRECLIALSETL